MDINANDLGLQDLDEFSGCDSLKSILRQKVQELPSSPVSITLDLSKCWLDYGFSHLYLDEALRILIDSKGGAKQLIIKVSVNLGERQFMAALLFPQSALIEYRSTEGPAHLADKLDLFCIQNYINLKIICMLDVADNTKSYEFCFGSPQ